MSRPFLACSVLLRCDKSGVVHSSLGIDTQPARCTPRGELHQVERHADGSLSVSAHLIFGALGCKVPRGIGRKQPVRVLHEGCDSLIAGLFVPRQTHDLNVAGVGAINVAKRAARPSHAFPPHRPLTGPACSCDWPFHLFGWVQASTWLWAGLGGVGFFFEHGRSVGQTARLVSNNNFRGL